MMRSSEISALRTREKKSWKVIDWCQSAACKNPKVKFEAAKFVLERIYPIKTVIGGEGIDGEIVIRVERGESADNLQAPRFAVPNLQ